jgi:hypothetical protein
MPERCPACGNTYKSLGSHDRFCKASELINEEERVRRSKKRSRNPDDQIIPSDIHHDSHPMGEPSSRSNPEDHPGIVLTHPMAPPPPKKRNTAQPVFSTRAKLMPLPPSSFGRARLRPLPRQLDPLPEDESGLYMTNPQDISDDEGSSQSPPAPSSVVTPAPITTVANPDEIITPPNKFGIYRIYPRRPTQDPDDEVPVTARCAAPTFETGEPPSVAPRRTIIENVPDNPFSPFLNWSISLLMRWWIGHKTHSLEVLQSLYDDVLAQEKFKLEEIRAPPFNAKGEMARLDKSAEMQDAEDGWTEDSVSIPVPCEGVHQEEATAHRYKVEGILRRKFMPVIRAACLEATSKLWNLTPYKVMYIAGPNAKPQRVQQEMYTSDCMYGDYVEISRRPDIKRLYPGVEIVIVGLMMWSDATHLTSFGTASLWPIYLFFGNLSKYIRERPSKRAAHHMAYIPKLADTFKDWYKETFGKAPSKEVLKHLRYELFKAVWCLLLDAEFLHAYEHGILLMFADGITRLVFPRFLTYSADYPEKSVHLLWI